MGSEEFHQRAMSSDATVDDVFFSTLPSDRTLTELTERRFTAFTIKKLFLLSVGWLPRGTLAHAKR